MLVPLLNDKTRHEKGNKEGSEKGNKTSREKGNKEPRSQSDKLSRELVALCRANADRHAGLVHRPDGCLPADRLMAVLQKKTTLALTDALLVEIIEGQADRRLAFKRDPDGRLWVFAFQGILNKYMAGTIRRELLYSDTRDTQDCLFHSTFARYLSSILDGEGLRPAARDVHLWGPENCKRGRGGADCVLRIDARAFVAETKATVWLAGNGVRLVERNIPAKYLALVFCTLY